MNIWEIYSLRKMQCVRTTRCSLLCNAHSFWTQKNDASICISASHSYSLTCYDASIAEQCRNISDSIDNHEREKKKSFFQSAIPLFPLFMFFFHPKNVFDFNRAPCRLHLAAKSPEHTDIRQRIKKIFYIVCSLLVIANPLDNFITIKIQNEKKSWFASAPRKMK